MLFELKLAELCGFTQSGQWVFNSTTLAEKKDIPIVPSALKNPNALTIKIGSNTVTYDGSSAQTVDMAEGEKWELINTLIVADGTEETNALIFNADLNGNAFQLKKARLCCAFPPYTGSSTIPNFSFSMLNGLTTGKQTSLGYTSVFQKLSATAATGSVWTIDVSGPLMAESVVRGTNWGDPTKLSRKYYSYGTQQTLPAEYFANTTFAYPITSIGGTAMLIYPGCRFELYGVRA